MGAVGLVAGNECQRAKKWLECKIENDSLAGYDRAVPTICGAASVPQPMGPRLSATVGSYPSQATERDAATAEVTVDGRRNNATTRQHGRRSGPSLRPC